MERGRWNVVADHCRWALYAVALTAAVGTVWALALVRSQDEKSAAAYNAHEPAAACPIEYDPPTPQPPDSTMALAQSDP